MKFLAFYGADKQEYAINVIKDPILSVEQCYSEDGEFVKECVIYTEHYNTASSCYRAGNYMIEVLQALEKLVKSDQVYTVLE